MGILLPPVSQVTNTRINLTQHHRNRSLDSALQRIPEVTLILLFFFYRFFSTLTYIWHQRIQQTNQKTFIGLILFDRWTYHHQMPNPKTFFAQNQYWVQQCVVKCHRHHQQIQTILRLQFAIKLVLAVSILFCYIE